MSYNGCDQARIKTKTETETETEKEKDKLKMTKSYKLKNLITS